MFVACFDSFGDEHEQRGSTAGTCSGAAGARAAVWKARIALVAFLSVG